jgi:hypothetical protein
MSGKSEFPSATTTSGRSGGGGGGRSSDSSSSSSSSSNSNPQNDQQQQQQHQPDFSVESAMKQVQEDAIAKRKQVEQFKNQNQLLEQRVCLFLYFVLLFVVGSLLILPFLLLQLSETEKLLSSIKEQLQVLCSPSSSPSFMLLFLYLDGAFIFPFLFLFLLSFCFYF